MNRGGQSSVNPTETHRMFFPRRIRNHKASRSKSVAEHNVGSLLCVDRLGSFFVRPGSDVEERVKAFLGSAPTVQQHRQSEGHPTSLFHRSYLAGDRRFFRTRVHCARFISLTERGLRASALRWPRTTYRMHFLNTQPMKWPQGASPARLVSTAGEGPVLCFHLSTDLKPRRTPHSSQRQRDTSPQRMHHRFESI